MTSTIESRLRAEVDLVQTFRALFPCGSITGAPKISTMEIIQKTEKALEVSTVERSASFLPKGKRIFNVAIRTLQMQGESSSSMAWEEASLGTSKWEGGIPGNQAKSAVLYRQEPRLELLTTGCIHQGELILLDQHVTRLREASRYFAYPYDESKLLKELQEELRSFRSQPDYRCRIALQKRDLPPRDHRADRLAR